MVNATRKDNNDFDKPVVFVGKDILELVGSSMYTDPLSIFREYIQNATDAIDDAIAMGLLSSIHDGIIDINLDHIDRRIVIRDNGKGLSNQDFTKRMLSFGASEKRGTDARGFRGVGRLAALGFVQQLVFRSRAEGDAEVLEACWNGPAIKHMLTSNDLDLDLLSVVKNSVTISRLEPKGYPMHFFDVELVKPRRIGSDRLLNEVEIESYISQVCPCPFSPEFSFGEEIAELLAPHGRAGKTYRIHINGAEKPVYRPYHDQVEYSTAQQASLYSLKTFEFESIDEKIAAIGWLIHHDYQGAIPSALGIRGLRARVGNIQIGHDRLLHEIFPEDRFCSWTIGEIHILDSRIVPNGRRDEFESNMHYDNIIAYLRPIGAEVAQKCRASSQKRSRLKTFKIASDKIYAKLDILEQGAVSKRAANLIKGEIWKLLTDMRKVVDFDLLDDEDRYNMRIHLVKIEEEVNIESTDNESDILKFIPANKRAIYSEIFDLIYDCSVNQVAAKCLIDRVLSHLSRR